MDPDDLRVYLERGGMKLEECDIDHIIPWRAFKQWGDVDEPFYQEAFVNYRNMQLLPPAQNASKGGRCTEEEFDVYIEWFASETM